MVAEAYHRTIWEAEEGESPRVSVQAGRQNDLKASINYAGGTYLKTKQKKTKIKTKQKSKQNKPIQKKQTNKIKHVNWILQSNSTYPVFQFGENTISFSNIQFCFSLHSKSYGNIQATMFGSKRDLPKATDLVPKADTRTPLQGHSFPVRTMLPLLHWIPPKQSHSTAQGLPCLLPWLVAQNCLCYSRSLLAQMHCRNDFSRSVSYANGIWIGIAVH